MRNPDEDWSMRTTLRDPKKKPKPALKQTPHEVMRQSMIMRSAAGARAASLWHDNEVQRNIQPTQLLQSPQSHHISLRKHSNHGRLAAGTMRKTAIMAISPSLPEWPNDLSDERWMTARSPPVHNQMSHGSGWRQPFMQRSTAEENSKRERQARSYDRMLQRAYASSARYRRPSMSDSSVATKLSDRSQSSRQGSNSRPESAKSTMSNAQGSLTWSSLRNVAGKMLRTKAPARPSISAPMDIGQVFLADRVENLTAQHQSYSSWAAEKLAKEEELANGTKIPASPVNERAAVQLAEARMAQLEDFLRRQSEHETILKRPDRPSGGLIGMISQATHKSRSSKAESNASASPMSFVCRGEYQSPSDEADPFASDSDHDPDSFIKEIPSTLIGLGIQGMEQGNVDSNRPEIVTKHMRINSQHPPVFSSERSPAPISGNVSPEYSAFFSNIDLTSLDGSAYHTPQQKLRHTPQIPRKPISTSELRRPAVQSGQGRNTDPGSPFTNAHSVEAYNAAADHWNHPPSQVHKDVQVVEARKQDGHIPTHDSTCTVSSGANGDKAPLHSRVSSWMTMSSNYRPLVLPRASAAQSFAQRAGFSSNSYQIPTQTSASREPQAISPLTRPQLRVQHTSHQRNAERDTAFYEFYDEVLSPSMLVSDEAAQQQLRQQRSSSPPPPPPPKSLPRRGYLPFLDCGDRFTIGQRPSGHSQKAREAAS